MTERQLLLLPNKDLWRGSVRHEPTAVDITVIEDGVELTPLDKAFQAITTAAEGGPLNCLWCGQQFVELDMRAHLIKNHGSVVNPITGPEAAMHTAAEAQQALEVSKEK